MGLKENKPFSDEGVYFILISQVKNIYFTHHYHYYQNHKKYEDNYGDYDQNKDPVRHFRGRVVSCWQHGEYLVIVFFINNSINSDRSEVGKKPNREWVRRKAVSERTGTETLKMGGNRNITQNTKRRK